MSRLSALKQCRYFSGEQTCPYSTDELGGFWAAEQFFFITEGKLNASEDDHYKSVGGKNYPGIPRALLVDMFVIWGKDHYDIPDDIDDFHNLVDRYLDAASEFYPKDKIPNRSV